MRTNEREMGTAGVAVEVSASRGAPGAGPGETVLAFTRGLLDGDMEVAASCFSPLARLLTPDGTEISGRSAIGQLLAQLVTPDQQLQIRTGRILRADSVALCNQFWTRSSRAVSVEGFESATTARLVLQRREEQWQIMIAAPWG